MPGLMLLDQGVDAFEHTGETVLVHGVAEIVVEHRATELGGVEELERLPVAQQLVERLRHRRQVQPRSLGRGVGEQALLGQDRLARTGSTDDQRDRVQHEPAAEHLVEPGVAGRESFHQETVAADASCRARSNPTGRAPSTRTAAARPAWPGTRWPRPPAPDRRGRAPTSPAPAWRHRAPSGRTARDRRPRSSARRSTDVVDARRTAARRASGRTPRTRRSPRSARSTRSSSAAYRSRSASSTTIVTPSGSGRLRLPASRSRSAKQPVGVGRRGAALHQVDDEPQLLQLVARVDALRALAPRRDDDAVAFLPRPQRRRLDAEHAGHRPDRVDRSGAHPTVIVGRGHRAEIPG